MNQVILLNLQTMPLFFILMPLVDAASRDNNTKGLARSQNNYNNTNVFFNYCLRNLQYYWLTALLIFLIYSIIDALCRTYLCFYY